MAADSQGLARTLRVLRLAPDDPGVARIQALWTRAGLLARPRTFARDLPRLEFLERFSPHASASLRLMRRLRGCDRVFVLAATLGPALERRVAELFARGLAYEGFALSRMGTYLADRTLRDLKAEIAARHPCGPSYSPGYQDFALEAQAPLVELAREGLPELSLSAGFALTPAMSVTAVMGRLEA